MRNVPIPPFYIRATGGLGLALLATTFHRWDWLYRDPSVWWRRWQGLLGLALCCVVGGLSLWNRVTPYSEPGSTADDALTILGLDPADKPDGGDHHNGPN